jgi:hypothetical protein
MNNHPNQNLTAGIRNLAKRLGLRTGFPTDADRAALPHVVRYETLSRERMGDWRFEKIYHAAIAAAEHVAGRLGYLVEPVSDNRPVVIGREFRFATLFHAVRFKLMVDEAMAGRRLRLPEVTK